MEQDFIWQKVQKENFRNKSALSAFLQLDVTNEQLLLESHFPLNLPYRLASKIAKNDLEDPLFKQFVPLKEESTVTLGYENDPLQEKASFQKTPKLLIKYPSRALLLCTSVCAMHCRFCFRKEFSYEKEYGYGPELAFLKKATEVEEVILSGGDPLALSTPALITLINELNTFDHIKRIRFHSRFIMGIPERVNPPLLKLFAESRCPIYFVLHVNHAQEFDDEIFQAIARLQQAGVVMLQQGVLMKGVNDSVDALKKLYTLLMNHKVLPYYLHQLDQTTGTAHFKVEIEKGLDLIQQVRDSLSGYGVPLYVKEIPSKYSKTPLTSDLASLDPKAQAPV